MKVLQINSVCGIRSTGRIATDFAEEYIKNGDECFIAYGREAVPPKYEKISYRIGTNFSVKFNAIMSRVFDNEGFNAKRQTRKFLKWADNYDPDVLWLHNLHGYYLNVEMLFDWIKSRPNMQVKWLLHDCWAFTGHCAYFTMANCHKWRECCLDCPQKKRYPSSIFKDNSKNNFIRKKKCFSEINNMTLVTPSHWLADLVRQSFLNEYPIEVRHNTIDTEVFKPTPSDFRKRYGLEGKKIILGVASTWDERKGLNDFIELSDMLDDTYAIVLVGLSDEQIKCLPSNVVSISKTDNVKKLVEIYSAADVFVNPSKEETFGLTTLEALSCGTDAIVYKDTACEEVVKKYGGVAVAQSAQSIKDELTQKFGGGKPIIVCFTATNNARELAAIYSSADVFLNLTYEDNYPTVNLESQACGTPCITYNTGGSVESVPRNNIIQKGDLKALVRRIKEIVDSKSIFSE